MSSIKTASISRKKKDLENSRLPNFLGRKHLRFNHQASLGDTSFDVMSLNNGISGFTQPNANDLIKVFSFKQNLRIYSSLDYELIPEKDYQVLGTTIQFINDLASAGAQEGEIFIGELQIPNTNAVVADAEQKVFNYTLPAGTTSLSLGNTFTVGANEILVYRNGLLQVEGASGNYTEVDSGDGFGTSIEFNISSSLDDSIHVVFGLVFSGDTALYSDMERLSGAILAMAEDLALATGNPIEDYITANASEVERNTFGTQVLDHETRIDELETAIPTFDDGLGNQVYYKSETVTLNGDYTAGTVRFVRHGDTVTLSVEVLPTHASMSSAASAAGFIPTWARPTVSFRSFVYFVTTSSAIERLDIYDTGVFNTIYWNSSFALTTKTSVGSRFAVSYNV